MRTLAATSLLLIVVAGCDGRIPFSGETATIPIEQGYGPNPTLPPPNPTLDSDRQHRAGQSLARGHCSDTGAGSCGQ